MLRLFYTIKNVPEKAFRLIWGRFVNTTGFVGKNLSLDLHMEHLNNFLKELIRSLRGNMSEDNCQRVAKSLHKTKLIVEGAENSLKTEYKTSSCSVPSSFDDVKSLTEAFHGEKIFFEISSMEYNSYPEFNCDIFKKTLEARELYIWVNKGKKKFT